MNTITRPGRRRFLSTPLPLALAAFALTIATGCKEYAKEVIVTEVTASSTKDFELRPYKYNPIFVMDGNGVSSWCDGGENKGFGESLTIKLDKSIKFNRIFITNGYNSKPLVKKTNKLNEKTAKYNFNQSLVPTKIELKAGETTATVTAKASDRETVLKTDSDLVGDTIKLTIKDIDFKKKRWKKTACITDIAFGYEEDGKDKKYPVKFRFKGNNKDWKVYYELALKEEFKTMGSRNYWLYTVMKKKSYSHASRDRAISGFASDPLTLPENTFLFNWQYAPDVPERFSAQSVDALIITASGESGPDGEANHEFKGVKIEPVSHTAENGIEFKVFPQDDSDNPLGTLFIKYLNNDELKDKSLNAKTMLWGDGPAGDNPATSWIFVLEARLVTTGGAEQKTYFLHWQEKAPKNAPADSEEKADTPVG